MKILALALPRVRTEVYLNFERLISLGIGMYKFLATIIYQFCLKMFGKRECLWPYSFDFERITILMQLIISVVIGAGIGAAWRIQALS